jgi:L-lactate dehydrogenase complex protein LldG
MQTNEAKSEIFDSIRRNLAESRPFDQIRRQHQAHKSKLVETVRLVSTASLQKVSLLERFRENLISIGGHCIAVESEREAARAVAEIIEKSQAKRVAVSDSPLAQKVKSGAEITENASAAELFDCDLGITGAQFGIAETGTLVLESEKEFNRLASLVPPVHVCVLETKYLRQTLGEVLEILEKDLSRTITFITGPSRTSDIELTLAIGVHGPAELYVILIDEK